MQHRTVEQIEGKADVVAAPVLSRRERLERWADVLEPQPRWLRAIPEIEYGSPFERDARRADDSPLALAHADPVLRAAGLRGDRIGDAAAFFELPHRQLHYLVCSCHHGRTVEPSAMASRLRALARRPKALAFVTSSTELAVGVGIAAALVVAALL
jgi:hypothetical protein